MDALGDLAQAFGTVIDRVHRRDYCEEHLGRADVAGGFLPADVLFPGLKSET